MKACSYCGGENDPTATLCYHCGSQLPVEAPETVPAPQQLEPRYLDLQKVAGGFDFDGGFHRPQWNTIRSAIESTVEPDNRGWAWDEAAAQWLQQLASDLGGAYQLRWSDRFFLVTAAGDVIASNLLRFAERARQVIERNLGEVAWRANVREAIIVFDEADDYYIANFYETDKMPRTGGVCITTGYPQIALVFHSETDACHTIAHELTHGSLQGLPLPLWLEEGVCETLRRMIGGPQVASTEGHSTAYWSAVSGWTPPVMWDELCERHHAFWTEKNIRQFWAGTSFGYEQEAQELSYSLAEVLVHLLSGDHEGFLAFLGRAHDDDAGQTAALECLDRNLGDVVAEFLGAGNWRPYRKAIVEAWAVSRPTASSDEKTTESK
jgi:hypothetical protein